LIAIHVSAPEFGTSVQKNAILRKTHSQPHPHKNSGLGGSLDQPKRKSTPSPLGFNKDAVENCSKSGPASPVARDNEKPLLGSRKSGPGSSGSPKPRRNIFEGFKNTLRPKSKSQDTASAGGSSRDSKASSTASSDTVFNTPDVLHEAGALEGHSRSESVSEDDAGAATAVSNAAS